MRLRNCCEDKTKVKVDIIFQSFFWENKGEGHVDHFDVCYDQKKNCLAYPMQDFPYDSPRPFIIVAHSSSFTFLECRLLLYLQQFQSLQASTILMGRLHSTPINNDNQSRLQGPICKGPYGNVYI